MDRTLIAVQNYDSYGYLKNSMDRFGDDLTEEVLQYLTFEDKNFRLNILISIISLIN